MSRIANTRPVGQREEPFRNRAYLDYLRTQPCILTGHKGQDVDPAHIGTLGRGVKFHDWGALPVWHDLHLIAHGTGEMSFWRTNLSDADLRAALRAWAHEMYREWEAREKPE